jgi:antitoxin (DNA-binding transcriptional repressor) of toxin-antitoxin stability system
METINENSLGNEVREAIKRAQETGQPVEIADEHGQVIARLVPAQHLASSPAHNQAWIELDDLIEAISRHLPEHVDAVETIRDVRR